MVYSDILDWLDEKDFESREDAIRYIQANQAQIVYPQQSEAIDYYYSERERQAEEERQAEQQTLEEVISQQEEPSVQEPQTIQPQTPLEALQQAELRKEYIPLVLEQPQIPAIEEEREIQESRLRRIIRRLFGR